MRVYLPYLAEITDAIAEMAEPITEIARCLNSRAELLDNASPVLAQLRHDGRQAHDRLSRRLQQIVNSSGARLALQEPIVTLRGGRYVVPVKTELRSQLPGIVHDVSSSGATVFLEPLEVVEMGNTWRETLAEEEREVQRILRHLSTLIGQSDDDIFASITALAEIDLSLAKARLGEALDARELPHEGPEQPWLLRRTDEFHLVNARHPLLTGHVIPISVWAGAQEHGFSVLLITGPNTGGKTVALKTVGLLALMAQAGLPVPADAGSRFPIFDAVYADIGDEQSIEQSLSTFSSHIGNIVSILDAATADSLVLLDELGAGTDPAEGAALAKAILSRLLRDRSLTVATTHHGELKAFAHVTDGLTNASVEFDPENLAPTYRLHIGLPGQSNALSIAQGLGMPASILDEARGSIDPDRLAVESLIVDLHRQREAAQTARAAQETAADAAQSARDRVTKELSSLEANRERLLERTRRELEDELAGARARLRDVVGELERAERLSASQRAAAVQTAQEQVDTVQESVHKIGAPPPPRPPRPTAHRGGRRPGLPARPPPPRRSDRRPDAQGEIEVKLGALRARISLKRYRAGREARVRSPGHRPCRPRSPPPSRCPTRQPDDLALRGLSVDQALPLIDQRLDEAFRAEAESLRIIHGKGTGTLRRAVREMLSKHPLVRSHAPAEPREGGDGVTVVDLAL